jgi:hypothetical protein
MRLFLLATWFCVVPSFIFAADDGPNNIVKVLESKDFWETAGKKDGRKWTAEELKQLENFNSSNQKAMLRLRANKVLVDLAGHGRYRQQDEAVVSAGFRYLEEKLQEKPVKKLIAEQGFTHYTISKKTDGTQWFLIEHVETGGFNGGLNLKVDEEDITDMQSWGAVSAN